MHVQELEPGVQYTAKAIGRRVPSRIIRQFSRDLAIMLGARMQLVNSLQIILAQCKHSGFQRVLRDLIIRLETGRSFADCVEAHPQLFDNFYMNLVVVGEATGRLAEMLQRLAEYQEKIADLKRKLIQALSYPFLVVSVAVAALSFILLFVLPTFEGLFREFDAELPLLTQIVMTASDLLQRYLPLIPLTIACAVIGYWLCRNHRLVLRVRDRIAIGLPFWGTLVKKNYLARFCRTLGTLLSSGITLLEGLQISAEITPNSIFRAEVNNMIFHVQQGSDLAGSLDKSKVFPAMIMQMIAVGEETAELPEMMLKVASIYGDELDRSIALMSTLIEPIMILFLGGLIGTILISIYLPLFNMAAIMP